MPTGSGAAHTRVWECESLARAVPNVPQTERAASTATPAVQVADS